MGLIIVKHMHILISLIYAFQCNSRIFKPLLTLIKSGCFFVKVRNMFRFSNKYWNVIIKLLKVFLYLIYDL
nr:MAG TPA: hypothetical protein [Caudoviricetes sp.]